MSYFDNPADAYEKINQVLTDYLDPDIGPEMMDLAGQLEDVAEAWRTFNKGLQDGLNKIIEAERHSWDSSLDAVSELVDLTENLGIVLD